ncbi:putative F420-dependent oxidoreductase [Thermosporothrix hazakensis]|uniref:Putative F420-dependent oxidoreductase n=1 Tax=Thermosporothrix hazakensis TaxID=644383 RepID=A0A326U845_THEHA|nr:TIGR03621 family F420-dependent LLM class oxidoreductase [Thermosporothrix hazakensis]PZW31238.1 putative F420-dependent oxidoreductase [Thermosporothrix hazakensis]GCE50852.1 LLM class F420-dependent oxidoreductase [Thermosporothrix hazakensis]
MSHPFRFGVVSMGTPPHTRSSWLDQARRCEDLGYSSLLMPDVPSVGGLAPFSALTMAAAVTTTLRIGSFVFNNELRHPLLLAREAATLDVFSNGRLELGLGVGYGPQESQKMGLPFASGGERVQHLQETIDIIKQISTKERVTYTGKYYTIKDVAGTPAPVQQPHPPILLAGAGERILKLAGREADIVEVAIMFQESNTSIEQKLKWVKEGAQERFPARELSKTVYYLHITDSKQKATAAPGGPQVPVQEMSTQQAIEHLLALREQYGFSYLKVHEGQIENFAPIVARLHGR